MWQEMDIAKFFTEEESERIADVQHQLFVLAADVMQEADKEKINMYMAKALEQGLFHPDPFGLNPIVKDTETALIVAQEIGLSRSSVLSEAVCFLAAGLLRNSSNLFSR